MEKTLYQMNDPWMDLGLIAFYQAIEFIDENEQLFDGFHLEPGYLTFSIDDALIDDVKKALIEYIRDQLNEILLPPVELKLLNKDWKKKNERGFYNEELKYTLSKNEIADLKTKTDGQGRAKPFLTQPKKNAVMGSARNYIGLKGDWRRMTQSFEEEIGHFFNQLSPTSPKNKTCPLCGREADAKGFRSMNQSRNVLFNQHHATAVRGYQAAVAKEKMCAVCNLLNLFATLQVNWLPYFINSQATHLLLPEVTNLRSLLKLVVSIASNGLHQNLATNKQITSYRTNIHHLSSSTLYVSLLQLYFWMIHRQEEAEFQPVPVDQRDRSALTGWLVARYNKGQTVIFKEFTRLSVDEDAFSLVTRIQYGQNRREGDVLHDFIYFIRSENEYVLDHIAAGIFKKNIQQIARNIYQLYKSSLKRPQKNQISSRGCLFFRAYLPYLFSFIHKEGDALFSEQLHDDLRLLGSVIGQYTDLPAMNKLNTASSQETLVAALKEALFKVYKQQLSNQKDQKASELYNIGTKRMQNILSQINSKNVFLMRDTLMIYASLAAFQVNNNKKKHEKELVEL